MVWDHDYAGSSPATPTIYIVALTVILMSSKVCWSNFNEIKTLISKCRSRSDILRKLGYQYKTSYQRRNLNQFITDHKIDISHFENSPTKWNQLPLFIKSCFSYADILKQLKLSLHGRNNETAKRYIKKFCLDTSHFYPDGIVGGGREKYSDEQVFCKDSLAHKAIMRRRFLLIRKDSYHCDKCNIVEWQSTSITLEVDHKSGDSKDHRLSNLRLLCPNCHSQTETFGFKKRKRF